MYLRCKKCAHVAPYDFEVLMLAGFVACGRCATPVSIVDDEDVEGKLNEPEARSLQVFEEGEIVKLDNCDHVWHGAIALICGKKPGFCRLEINGNRLWVPNEWVTKNEFPDLSE